MSSIRTTPEYLARVEALRAIHPAQTPAGHYILELAKVLSLLVIPLAISGFGLLLVTMG